MRDRLCAALLGLVFSTAAVANDDLAPTPEQVTERNTDFLSIWDALRARESGLRIRLEPGLVNSGKFEGSRIGWYRTGISFEAGLPLSDRANLGISPSFAYERLESKSSDDFVVSAEGNEQDSDVADFIAGGLTLGANYRFEKGWGAEAAMRASYRMERGAKIDEALQVGGSLAATYRRGKWLRLRLGIGLGTDIGDQKLKISPVYRIVVRPIPTVSLSTSGINGSVEWDVTPVTSLSLGGGINGTQYKLERRTGFGDGSLQRRQKEVTLGARYRPRKWLRVGAELGVVFHQELTVLNQDGKETDQREDKDPSASFVMRFEFRL